MATLDKFYTTQEAADRLGLTDGRIRQLFIEHSEIGQKHGKMWLLTEADIIRIQTLPDFRKKSSRAD